MAPLARKHLSVRDAQREEGGTEIDWLCHLPASLAAVVTVTGWGEKLRLILPWAIAAAQVPAGPGRE